MTGRIRGVLAPVVTPFKADLTPDSERFTAHCRWLLSQDCGLAVFGTNSEANSLSLEERLDLLNHLVAAGIDPARMMPGTGCCSVMETVWLTRQAVGRGCAGVLMLPPFYYKDVSEEGLYCYFSEVVQRVGDARLKIYLYNIPPVAIVRITPKLVERLLAAYPSVIAGMKDSSGDWNTTKTFLNAFSATAGATHSFDVFVGSESFLLANMRDGGAGCISATANVNPAAIDALYQKALAAGSASTSDIEHQPRKGISEIEGKGAKGSAKRGRVTSEFQTSNLERQQADLDIVRDVFAQKSWPSMIAALKQAIAIYRNDPEWARVRPPLVDFTPEQAELLADELKAVGFRWRS
ncbi:MAG: dihydrodipicolinate synthase family protein [Nitrospirota bacterium]